jgi:hypothetical protein
MTPLLIGVVLAVATFFFARRTGLGGDRAFYPTVLIVVASVWVLFATMGGSPRAILVESLVMAGFTAVAVAGFKRSSWLVLGGIAAHALFDAVHGRLRLTSGAPTWWPAFCGAYDAALPICMVLLQPRRVHGGARDTPAR